MYLFGKFNLIVAVIFKVSYEHLNSKFVVHTSIETSISIQGHTSGVYAFDFNQDSTRAITASRDGSWKLYDTDIRYQQGEEPKQLASGQWDVLRTAAPDSVFAAITPSGDSFAIGASRHVRMYSTEGMVDTDYQPSRSIICIVNNYR